MVFAWVVRWNASHEYLADDNGSWSERQCGAKRFASHDEALAACSKRWVRDSYSVVKLALRLERPRLSSYDPASELDNVPLGDAEEERDRAKAWLRTAAQYSRNADHYKSERDDWERRATRLWQLLDDIDTQDDASRSDDAHFRVRARRIAKLRFPVLTTSPDGQSLRVPAGEVSCT